MLINITTLKHRSGSLQAIVNSTIQEIAQEVLLIFHSNCGPILYCFRDIQPRIIVALEILVRGRSRSLKMVPFESFHTVTHSHSIVTMALSYIISKTKWDIAQKSQFLYPLYLMPPLRGSQLEYCHNVCMEKLHTRMVWLPDGDKVWWYVKLFRTFDAVLYTVLCDGQTSCDNTVCATPSIKQQKLCFKCLAVAASAPDSLTAVCPEEKKERKKKDV